jgi:hypothetical protein
MGYTSVHEYTMHNLFKKTLYLYNFKIYILS